MMRALITALLVTLAQPVHSASFNFCWQGANGYTMTGKIVFPDANLNQAVITQDDLTAFKITGYLNGAQIGTWNMDQRSANTTWHLRFEPKTGRFPVGGGFPSESAQGWNAHGAVNDCGVPGFGFNAASGAQDVCVNGTFIRDSSIARDTPLFATTAPVTADCRQTVPLSKR